MTRTTGDLGHLARSARPAAERGPLSLRETLRSRRLVVIGGTGFLGKVWWAHLLFHFPEVARVHLVVRSRPALSAEARFWKEIATSPVLDPLRAAHGEGFEAFLRERIEVLDGDVVRPFCGFSEDVRARLRGGVDAVVNVAGVVDFDPPLDEALEVNAFGVQNLVALARDLGEVPLLHTSTCFVAGDRTGFIEEQDPREHPFPRADELELSHWDPDREIAECLDVIEQARHRSNDAFRQSHFLDEARRNLERRHEPARGRVLEREIERVKRRFVEGELSRLGMERANFWGFPNTYTYTKSIGEQICAKSGLRFTIVRPAIVESTVTFPFPGWNEGINTSAPLIYALREGQTQIPGSDHALDVVPCDMVAGGTTLALAELLEGDPPPVVQLGTSDTNPLTMRRAFELSGLYKRRYYQRTGRGGPILGGLYARFEGALLSREQFESYGPLRVAEGAKLAAKALRGASVGPAAALLKPAARALDGFGEQQRKVGEVLKAFLPFVAVYDYVFRCDAVRAADARLSGEERRIVGWAPDAIDWRHYFLEVHIPGLEKWVFPEIDRKVRKERGAPARHETLPALLDEMAERHDLAVALMARERDGLSRLSFRDLRGRALACAARLREAGVEAGDRVLLAGKNHPEWAIALFGVLAAGATAVPLEEKVETAAVESLARASRARVLLADEGVLARVESPVPTLAMSQAAAPGRTLPPAEVLPEDVALLIYTSGTTGVPKGVMLSHQNLTALVASLAPLFPLGPGDRILSVLPLHHTFELTCGLLLPLSRGARVVYLDELAADSLLGTLADGRITGLVGVPALWELVERRLSARVAERGRLVAPLFEFLLEVNRSLGRTVGLDLGRTLFGPVHEALGGQLRFLVSGGAALPEQTQRRLAGLGLHLAEGYGLTEAAPVLTVAEGKPGQRAGHVGKPVPGVEVRIHEPDAEGVGEILARGPNVMLGYADDPESTARVLDPDGWLHTGDLGKLDRQGNLRIVGRAKDVVVASNGENVYPDDVEAKLGEVEHVAELTVLGVPDGRGGERVALVAVVAAEEGAARAERHRRARRSLDRAMSALLPRERPAVVALVDAPLPRTATRKVKRAEVRRMLDRIAAASERPPAGDAGPLSLGGAERMVRGAVSALARRPLQEIRGEQTLRGELGFDSLMLLELLLALEAQVGGSLDADRLNDCETVADAERMVREAAGAKRAVRDPFEVESEEERPVRVPPLVREAAMAALGDAQMGFYRRVLRAEVTGRAFIPHDRNTLVAANHASHLDMGLVKYALGSYGQGIVALAAQDYFFEGGKWRKAYFENFTNLVPLSRQGSLRQSLRQAGSLLDEGKTVLIFPEGTRYDDGVVHEFKPAIGWLALHHRTDVLPVWLGNTHLALPKGAAVLRRRDVKARIGPPLPHELLRSLTEGLSAAEAPRAVARLVRRAVVALSEGRVLDPGTLRPADLREADPEVGLAPLFAELERRFVPGVAERELSFYFALGEERWTLVATAESCVVHRGKTRPQVDCVLKTSPAMFTRIVREAYTPTPGEFVSGEVKSNDIALLVTFQKLFGLVGG